MCIDVGCNVADVEQLLTSMDSDPLFYKRNALPERAGPDSVNVKEELDETDDKNKKTLNKNPAAKVTAKGKAKAKAKSRFQKDRAAFMCCCFPSTFACRVCAPNFGSFCNTGDLHGDAGQLLT